jgi:hypothetical protein
MKFILFSVIGAAVAVLVVALVIRAVKELFSK